MALRITHDMAETAMPAKSMARHLAPQEMEHAL